ncbi:MAG: type VI secretion system tube protein Hcp [Proteobacteria bacterium]|nr:type VI secretion system tube protein Hcp [Pseudomonadota bacterium]
MSMYLNIPGIAGSTTAQGYQQWIPICAINWGLDRPINTIPGKTGDRIRSSAIGYEIEIIKDLDQSSPSLFGQVCGGKAIPEVQIHICYFGNDGPLPYLQYRLSNVLVSEYYSYLDEDNHQELIALNYTECAISHIQYDSQHQPVTSCRISKEIGCCPSPATYFRRQIQKRTEEGFNLFVATVFGEMAGVNHSREVAWQAVGSVILNRVATGIWWRYQTPEAVIKHTGFDAYLNPYKINNWNKRDFFTTSPVKGHEQFVKAWAFLHKQHINHHPGLSRNESALLNIIGKVLAPIYFQGKTITKANFYYSPRGMCGKKPSFLRGIDKPEQYKEYLPGLDEAEITLYFIPAKISRWAGDKIKRKEK